MNFGLRALRVQTIERRLELVDRHPVAVHLDLHDVGLIGAERRHRPRIGGGLRHDHVARVDQRLAHEVDHLLAAGRDDHVRRIDRGALGGHHLDDAIDRDRHSLGRAVLERSRGRLRRHLGHQLRVELRRERARIGQATGERDHVGALGQRHHLAHRRAFHPARARGEQGLVTRELVRCRTGASSIVLPDLWIVRHPRTVAHAIRTFTHCTNA